MKKLTALKLTLAAAPIVFLLTVGLCWLTGAVAEAFGLHLPEQPSLDLVRNARGWELVGWIAATDRLSLGFSNLFAYKNFKIILKIIQTTTKDSKHF